ncbi:unnamed protein product [Prunus armeniaca]
MVATFLLIVGQNNRYCLVRDIFGQLHFTASKNFNKILEASNTITPERLAKPGSTIPTEIRESTRVYLYFKDCIGAIDGTHIPAIVMGRDVTSYCNRHGTISQNVLAPCNFDLEFIYFLNGWEGSAHNSRVLHDALTRRNGLKVPQCVQYNLQEFGGQGRAPANEVELFNLRHLSLRNVIERIFEMVLACVGLYNFLLKECRSYEFSIELENESSSSSSLPVNERDPELVFQTQEQQRHNSNEWRVCIALDMWRDAGHNDNNENRG